MSALTRPFAQGRGTEISGASILTPRNSSFTKQYDGHRERRGQGKALEGPLARLEEEETGGLPRSRCESCMERWVWEELL